MIIFRYRPDTGYADYIYFELESDISTYFFFFAYVCANFTLDGHMGGDMIWDTVPFWLYYLAAFALYMESGSYQSGFHAFSLHYTHGSWKSVS